MTPAQWVDKQDMKWFSNNLESRAEIAMISMALILENKL